MTFPGAGHHFPYCPEITLAPAVGNILLDATGEKGAFAGRVWYKEDVASKNIQSIGIRFGTNTTAGGSAMTLSLQDVSSAAGPPYEPDDTQDQTVAISNADLAAFSGAWYWTGNLSANRTVAKGDQLAVVIEYNGSGRLGSDAVNIQGLSYNANQTSGIFHNGLSLFKATTTWAIANIQMNVILRFDDGTYGTLDGAVICDAVANQSINQNATPDEYALGFQVPYECSIDGIWAAFSVPTNASCEVILYEGTTALKTFAIPYRQVRSNGGGAPAYLPMAKTTLTPGVMYYIAIRGTASTNVNAFMVNVPNEDSLELWPGGKDFKVYTRTDQGAWSVSPVSDVRRMLAGVRFTDVFF